MVAAVTGMDAFGLVVVLLVLLAWPLLDEWLRCPGDVDDFADTHWPDCFPEAWVSERLYDQEKDAA